MKALRGKSGVLHTFDRLDVVAGVESVVDDHEDEADEFDVITLYAKMIDVGARSAELVAPSFSSKARELVSLYGLKLKIKREVVLSDS